MMKKSLIIACSLLAVNAGAQQLVTKQPTEVIVANGGVFETMPPYADRATIGTYSNGNYSVFDTIYVEGVSDVEIYNDHSGANQYFEIYVAAQDSVVRYDDNYQRVAVIGFSGVRCVKAFDDIFVIGNWYGTNNAIEVYDKSSNTFTFGVPISLIPYTVNDIDIHPDGDSLYVAYSVPGTIDNCPPWGCYDDSLGRIAVVSLNTQTVARTIDLAEDGAGVKGLSVTPTGLMAIAEFAGNIIEYPFSSHTASVIQTGVVRYVDKHTHGQQGWNEGLAYMTSAGLKNIDGSGSVIDLGINPSWPNAIACDFINDGLFYTYTDWSTYGEIIHEGVFGLQDSSAVGISPDALAIRYELIGGGVEEHAQEVRVYPNPNNGSFIVDAEGYQSYQVFGVNGALIGSGVLEGCRINVDLTPGFYVLKLIGNEKLGTSRIVVK